MTDPLPTGLGRGSAAQSNAGARGRSAEPTTHGVSDTLVAIRSRMFASFNATPPPPPKRGHASAPAPTSRGSCGAVALAERSLPRDRSETGACQSLGTRRPSNDWGVHKGGILPHARRHAGYEGSPPPKDILIPAVVFCFCHVTRGEHVPRCATLPSTPQTHKSNTAF